MLNNLHGLFIPRSKNIFIKYTHDLKKYVKYTICSAICWYLCFNVKKTRFGI